MAESRAAIRYAKAALSLASDQNSSETVNESMQAMAQAISGHQDLANILKNSVVKADDKKSVLLKVFPQLDDISNNLIDLLVSNKRIDILEEVAIEYNRLYDKLNGKEKATVTTAIPMTNDLELKVLAKVKELTTKAVELENIVDESILGGFILRVGDKQYNASVASQLNKLKREFTLN